METVDSISFQAFVALTDPALFLVVDSAGGSRTAQVDLGAVEPVPVTLPVLHGSTELAALRGNFGYSTLLHLGVFTDGTAPILWIVEARSSPGGEGVLVVWYSLAAHFRFRVLTPFLHGGPTLLPAIDTSPTFFPHSWVEKTLSIGHRLLVLPLPCHLGVLDEGSGVGRSAGTLACFTALFTTVGHHVLY